MAFQYGILSEEKKIYTSFERIYVDANGQVCDEDSPNVALLLVGEGCQIPWADALAAGQVPAHRPAVDRRSARSPGSTRPR